MTAFVFVAVCFGAMFVVGFVSDWLDGRTYRGPDFRTADRERWDD